MKKNRAIRTIEALQSAPNKTLTLFEFNKILGTDWSPRGINEARKIGANITGHNPYTLVDVPESMKIKKTRWIFNNETNMAYEVPA